jgi:hypothetical protein
LLNTGAGGSKEKKWSRQAGAQNLGGSIWRQAKLEGVGFNSASNKVLHRRLATLLLPAPDTELVRQVLEV